MEILDKNKFYDIVVVIDRLVIKEGIRFRVYDVMEMVVKFGEGKIWIIVNDYEVIDFSECFFCEGSDFIIFELEFRLFLFNILIGVCLYCNGLGLKMEVVKELVVNFEKGLFDGGIIFYCYVDENNLNI